MPSSLIETKLCLFYNCVVSLKLVTYNENCMIGCNAAKYNCTVTTLRVEFDTLKYLYDNSITLFEIKILT